MSAIGDVYNYIITGRRFRIQCFQVLLKIWRFCAWPASAESAMPVRLRSCRETGPSVLTYQKKAFGGRHELDSKKGRPKQELLIQAAPP